MKLFSKLWMDDAGFIVSSELILIATLVVIGLIAGLSTLRDQVVQELADVADAVSELNQTYSWSGIESHSGSTAGSLFADTNDFCEDGSGDDQSAGNEPQCLEINGTTALSE